MDEFPFSALFLFAQSCLTDAVNVIFSDYCFTDTYLSGAAAYFHIQLLLSRLKAVFQADSPVEYQSSRLGILAVSTEIAQAEKLESVCTLRFC